MGRRLGRPGLGCVRGASGGVWEAPPGFSKSPKHWYLLYEIDFGHQGGIGWGVGWGVRWGLRGWGASGVFP